MKLRQDAVISPEFEKARRTALKAFEAHIAAADNPKDCAVEAFVMLLDHFESRVLFYDRKIRLEHKKRRENAADLVPEELRFFERMKSEAFTACTFILDLYQNPPEPMPDLPEPRPAKRTISNLFFFK